MSLIIFNKRQEVTFQRFAISVLSGSAFMLILGVVHGWLHHMHYFIDVGTPLDVRLLLIASVVGIILTIIYFYQGGAGAWSEEVRKAGKTNTSTPVGWYTHAKEIRQLFLYMVVGNVLLLGIGLYAFVWQGIVLHLDFIRALANIAFAGVAVLLPLNYAALLQLDSYTDGAEEALCTFAQDRFYRILYWVLVAYWASLFAAYILLLVFSQAYCQYLIC